ncbi:hypothetical protein [Microbacterium aurugineum]|uniref:hypothetical protein n=2 Tax=Microbacterium TaxID=33882 RepID=UPI00355809C9
MDDVAAAVAVALLVTEVDRSPAALATVGDRSSRSGMVAAIPRFVQPGPVRLGRVTYILTNADWVYAAFVIDVFKRRVVGWHTSTNMRTDLALDALDRGLLQRQRTGQDSDFLMARAALGH